MKKEKSPDKVTGKVTFSPRDISTINNKLYKKLSITNYAEDAVVSGKVTELPDEQHLAQRFQGSSPGHGASALNLNIIKECLIT